MKVTGIIAEYNPFHNGHKYHLEQARIMTDCEYVIVIMSGDYTQRGTPAIYSKYMRARSALLAGADLVLEMPVFGSVSSAPDFARCGVSGLTATGVCDHLFFGSEAGSIDHLSYQADLLDKESDELSHAIKAGLKDGLTWPQARAQAYRSIHFETTDEIACVSDLPNDILGVEYIRSIRALRSPITPVTLKRNDPGYHSEERFGKFASATASRRAILDQDLDFLQDVLPEEHFQCLAGEACPPVTFNDFSLLLNEKILNSSPEQILNISGMPQDLANKLDKNRMEFLSADALVAARKDRNYTYTRVNRCLLNLILEITQKDSETFKELNSVPWLRILGFRKEASPLLSEMKKHASAPIISKMANAEQLMSPEAQALFRKHVRSAELYRMIAQLKSGQVYKNEFTRPIIIL